MMNERDELAALHARIAELEAKRAELEPYARFFEHSLAMLCISDGKGRFLRVNRAWEGALGWSVEELCAGSFLDFVHPDDLAATHAAMDELGQGRPNIAFENRYRCKDGRYRCIRWFCAPPDASGLQHAVAQDITEQRQAEQRARVYEDTILSSATGTFVCHLERPGDPTSLRLILANEAAEEFTGVPMRAELGRLFLDVFPNVMQTGLPMQYMEVAMSGGARDLGEVAYGDARVAQGYFSVRAFSLPGDRVCVNFENITERKRAEEVRIQSARQEEIIRAQAEALAELSTPLIPLSDDVVVMPLIGTLDARRAEQVIAALLTGVASRRTRTAILDITGVAGVDTQIADALIRAARGVRLLGARVMLTGIRPEVASTLVELGVSLDAIHTYGTLQAGVAAAFQLRRA